MLRKRIRLRWILILMNMISMSSRLMRLMAASMNKKNLMTVIKMNLMNSKCIKMITKWEMKNSQTIVLRKKEEMNLSLEVRMKRTQHSLRNQMKAIMILTTSLKTAIKVRV
jgi:hypothetical protein